MLDIFGPDSDDDEDKEEEVGFLDRAEEEDNYDMAENGFND